MSSTTAVAGRAGATTGPADLVERARALAPQLAARSAEGEAARRLAPASRDALADAGFFRLLTPRALGGLECDPVTASRVIETVAAADSAAGWALMSGNSVDWWCARLPGDGAADLYAESADAILAAAFHPPVRADAVEGGYALTGRAPLASNVHDSSWVLLTALVHDDGEPRLVGGAPAAIGALVPTRDLTVHDTWHTLGMRGTDSNDVEVAGVVVPIRHTFALQPDFEPGPAYRGPLYRLPGMAEVAVVGPPVLLGIAGRALDALRDVAGAKTPFGSLTPLAARTSTHAAVGRAEALLASARRLLHGVLGDQFEQAGRGVPFTLAQRAEAAMAGAHVTASAVDAVEVVFAAAGTSGIYERSPLERAFRDVQTLRHHGFFSPARYETVGQVLLGVEPEFGLVTF